MEVGEPIVHGSAKGRIADAARDRCRGERSADSLANDVFKGAIDKLSAVFVVPAVKARVVRSR